MSMEETLAQIIRREIHQPVPQAVQTAAKGVRDRHGDAVAAILFYGSCLRDQSVEGKVIDFYVLVERYHDIHKSWIMRAANALIPPNVYYLEVPDNGGIVRIKYAVYTLNAFNRGASQRTIQSTIWARFAQPCILLYARSDAVEGRIVSTLVKSITTLMKLTTPLMATTFSSKELWVRAFQESYGSELRAERSDRPAQLYDHFETRYEELSKFCLIRAEQQESQPQTPTRYRNSSGKWARALTQMRCVVRRLYGKFLTILRLMKAAFTFDGGLHYILWKIETHSAVRVRPTPWQERHPVLAAPILAWRLYRQGAFR